MKNEQQILAFIGDLVDMYRESEEIIIGEYSGNMTADFEELETKCDKLMYQAQKLVA